MEADADGDAGAEAEMRASEIHRMVRSSGEPQVPLEFVRQILIPSKLSKCSMTNGERFTITRMRTHSPLAIVQDQAPTRLGVSGKTSLR